jgi:hypothetical protein
LCDRNDFRPALTDTFLYESVAGSKFYPASDSKLARTPNIKAKTFRAASLEEGEMALRVDVVEKGLVLFGEQ